MHHLTLLLCLLSAEDFPPGVYPGHEKPAFREVVEATPTPYTEVVRVIELLPKPTVGFVDFGCGADARWCIVAAEKWNCRVTGVEIDPGRANTAREHVRLARLEHLITIVEGDATQVEVQADVGVAYLYQDVLDQLTPKLTKLKAFASYLHKPSKLSVTQNGDSWVYTKPVPVHTAIWNGQAYTQPVCNNPNCGMCASIRAQLAQLVQPKPEAAAGGHYERRKFCNGRSCWFADVWIPN